jgi:O-acetyl-ADP-ribose deacetylase (regulator of RNase III)
MITGGSFMPETPEQRTAKNRKVFSGGCSMAEPTLDARIQLMQGDITKLKVEAIVNAANRSLLGGGGVDGAIHRAGGPQILAECRDIRNRQGGCPTGEAVITSGGQLPVKYVIHTVGPVWNGGSNDEAGLLADCYQNSLALAVKYQIRTIAFPNISTGVYAYPKDAAARIAVATVRDFFKHDHTLQSVCFVCFDRDNLRIYEGLLK